MRFLWSLWLCLCSTLVIAQQPSSINSGGLSNSQLIHSVGDIYVKPLQDPNQNNSGLLGSISRINFFVGINKVLFSKSLTVYPNPTYQQLFLEVEGVDPIEQIWIYDTQGRLVASPPISQQGQVNLSELPDGVYMIRTNLPTVRAIQVVKMGK